MGGGPEGLVPAFGAANPWGAFLCVVSCGPLLWDTERFALTVLLSVHLWMGLQQMTNRKTKMDQLVKKYCTIEVCLLWNLLDVDPTVASRLG